MSHVGARARKSRCCMVLPALRCAPTRFLRPCIPESASVHARPMHQRVFCACVSLDSRECTFVLCTGEDSRPPRHEIAALHRSAGPPLCTGAHFASLHPGIRARARPSHAPARFLRLCILGIAGVRARPMHQRAFRAPAPRESRPCMSLLCTPEDSRHPRHEIAALHRSAGPPPCTSVLSASLPPALPPPARANGPAASRHGPVASGGGGPKAAAPMPPLCAC